MIEGDGFNTALLFIRVVAGITVFLHGYNKFFGGGKLKGTANWFSSLGMRPNGKVHAWLAATTEVGASTLLAIGLLTPFAAAGIVGIMVVATWTHKDNGFFIFRDGWEYNTFIAATVITIATLGPGKYSLDHVLDLPFPFDPGWGMGISAGLGIGAGALLLALAWREPPKKVEDAA